MQPVLGKAIGEVCDGENNPVDFDFAYPLVGDIEDAIRELKDRHGEDICLLPLSGASTGGGILQNPCKPPGPVIGLRLNPPVEPRIRLGEITSLTDIGLGEIVIDRGRQQVCAGASVTLHQLNQALSAELGHCFKVPGADLTSYRYAAVGATFMTGGMGPQRRYFSDSVSEITLFDGDRIVTVEGESLLGYAGTYGWSGLVCALRFDFYRFPANEIAFALPVSAAADRLSALLDHLSIYTDLDLKQKQVESAAGPQDLILGIEHVSIASMQPLLRGDSNNPACKRAAALLKNCQAASADGLIFVIGFSDRSSDEFLLELADDIHSDFLSIGGVAIEHAEIFADPEEMRAVREAIPYAARTQTITDRFSFKNHCDANIRIPRENTADLIRQVWEINCAYVGSVEQYFQDNQAVEGQILVYGHLNPYGLDPHNRVTMSSNDESAFADCRDFLIEQRAVYYRSQAALCESSKAVFVGGEKTADSEIAIYRALGGPEKAPAALFARFLQQQAIVQGASIMFNWRALAPYCLDRA